MAAKEPEKPNSENRPPPFCPHDEARMQVLETKLDHLYDSMSETRQRIEDINDRLNGPLEELIFNQADEIVKAIVSQMETQAEMQYDLDTEKLQNELKKIKKREEAKVERWKIVAAVLTGSVATALIQIFL